MYKYDERTIDQDVENTLGVAAHLGTALCYRMNDLLIFVATGKAADALYPSIKEAERLLQIKKGG